MSIIRKIILLVAPLLILCFLTPLLTCEIEMIIGTISLAYLFWGFAIHCANRGFKEGNALLDKLNNLDRITYSLDEINRKL